MRKLILFSLLISSTILTGCSKDAEVRAFITELDSITKEVVAQIDADPTSGGIDRAQKTFDARKPGLTAKWDKIKDAVGFQISPETKKTLEESVKNNMKALTDASIRNIAKMAADKQATVKFQRLLSDYGSTFQKSST